MVDGLSHSEIRGSIRICQSPRLIAAYHVLLRHWEPRHSPCALIYFLFSIKFIILLLLLLGRMLMHSSFCFPIMSKNFFIMSCLMLVYIKLVYIIKWRYLGYRTPILFDIWYLIFDNWWFNTFNLIFNLQSLISLFPAAWRTVMSQYVLELFILSINSKINS